jgi:hypothetical protein
VRRRQKAKAMELWDRIHQDVNFDVVGFDGCRVEEVLGLVNASDPDNLPIYVNLKVTRHLWQRFFLDAGLGFWEAWGDLRDDTDEETRFVDYATLYRIKGESICSIQCRECAITIVLESGARIVLSPTDGSFGAKSELQIFRNDGAKEIGLLTAS